MQQDNNDMENKLRQLENQQLPDLSNMDKHWQEMEHMLTAGVSSNASKKRSFIKLHIRKLFLAAAVISIAFAAWFFIAGNPKKDSITPIVKAPIETKTDDKSLTETTNPKPSTGTQQNDQNPSKQIAHTQPGNNKEPEIKAGNQPAPGNKTTDEDIAAAENIKEDNSGKMLAAFYEDIQKSVQEFDVEASEGASLTGREGTIIAIPSSAFIDDNGRIVTGLVKLKLEEFYKYSDMIAANLTTTSDGKQLITGGMVKITATANGINVNLRSSKEINLVMPTRNYDAGMKLFTSDNEGATNPYASYAVMKRDINWNLTGPQDALPVFDGKTNFLDKLDQPYNVIKTANRRIAKFALSNKCPLTTNQMKVILKEKYGDHYDVIKVKREDGKEKASNFFYRGKLKKENVIGDSTRITLEQALRLKYIDKSETAYYAEKIKADSIRFFDEYAKTKNAYLFTVTKLGWINCDKYSNHTNRTNFVINLPADVRAEKFVTQLVFMSTHSVMPGRISNNQIGFQDIPADMGVYIVGLGERNGKVVSFMQQLKIGGSQVSINDLQETTPEAFRKKLTELDIN